MIALDTDGHVADGGDCSDDPFSDTESEDFVLGRENSLEERKSCRRPPIPAPEELTKEDPEDKWASLMVRSSKKDKKKKKKALLRDVDEPASP